MQIYFTDPESFEKHTGETFNFKFDFTQYLPTGSTVVTGAVTAYDKRSKQQVTSVLSGASTTTDAGLKVQQAVTGGDVGGVYILQCSALLTTGETLVLCTAMHTGDGLM